MAIVLDGTTGLAGAATGALNGTLGSTTPSTVVATTVVASSTIKGATTIAVGNATPSASGAGITFPATQSASTDANTLDDYEEGTWTPVVKFGGASVGITGTFTGTYTKVGNLLTIGCRLTFTNKGSSTGSMTVDTLPFNVGANIPASSGFSYVHQLAAAQTSGQMYIQGDSTTFYFKFVGYSSSSTPSLTNSSINNSTDIQFAYTVSI